MRTNHSVTMMRGRRRSLESERRQTASIGDERGRYGGDFEVDIDSPWWIR